MIDRIIRANELANILGVSVSTVWNKSNPKNRHYDDSFPLPFKLSSNVTGWKESEINEYINKKQADTQRGNDE